MLIFFYGSLYQRRIKIETKKLPKGQMIRIQNSCQNNVFTFLKSIRFS